MSSLSSEEELMAEVECLRLALKPFAEIAKRLGWATLEEDDRSLGDHILEAPADDIKPGAFYCLMVAAFRNAALAYGETATAPAAQDEGKQP